MTTAGAVLCVLRARFFRLEVRLFGTAMGLFLEVLRFLRVRYFEDSFSLRRVSHRGSASW